MGLGKKATKVVFWGLVYLFVFVNVMFLNVVLHELGHYAAAQSYGLEPKIELNFDNLERISFGLKSISLATTSFNDNGNENELKAIVLMGVFMNLILGVCFSMVFVFFKGKEYIAEIGLIGAVVSLGSLIMNLLPIQGVDGSFIFGTLF